MEARFPFEFALFMYARAHSLVAPHIGHLYSAVLADAVHRWEKLIRMEEGDAAVLSTGTDEHGLKVQKAAQAAGHEPKTFCDAISRQFKVSVGR